MPYIYTDRFYIKNMYVPNTMNHTHRLFAQDSIFT